MKMHGYDWFDSILKHSELWAVYIDACKTKCSAGRREGMPAFHQMQRSQLQLPFSSHWRQLLRHRCGISISKKQQHLLHILSKPADKHMTNPAAFWGRWMHGCASYLVYIYFCVPWYRWCMHFSSCDRYSVNGISQSSQRQIAYKPIWWAACK